MAAAYATVFAFALSGFTSGLLAHIGLRPMLLLKPFQGIFVMNSNLLLKGQSVLIP
jgi:hypothetical protein